VRHHPWAGSLLICKTRPESVSKTPVGKPYQDTWKGLKSGRSKGYQSMSGLVSSYGKRHGISEGMPHTAPQNDTRPSVLPHHIPRQQDQGGYDEQQR